MGKVILIFAVGLNFGAGFIPGSEDGISFMQGVNFFVAIVSAYVLGLTS
jgi:hypothetical protein